MENIQQDDMRGNVVFFYSYGTNTWDTFWTKTVQRGTGGPFVHVEMVYDYIGTPSQKLWRTIGARSDGVKLTPLPTNVPYLILPLAKMSVDMAGNPLPIDAVDLTNALSWARTHLGMTYGSLDNFTQTIDLLWAACPVHLTQPDHFNCSNFVAAIIDKIGIVLPTSFTYPFDVSPNDLAEWGGLLPARHRIKT